MKRAFAAALGLVALVVAFAFAPAKAADVTIYWQCASTSASGVTTYGQCPANTTYPLPVAPANTSTTPLYVAGFDSGSAPAIGAGATQTPANSSHTAGKVVGGLFTIPVARIAGGSGAVSRFFGYSVAGDTTGLLWRIWDKSPGATTCTDNANFVGSATDDLHLIAQPFSATPAAAAQTQGDAKTYFENDFVPPASYKNQDTSPSVNIYACAVATATFTPGVGAYSVDATGYQN